MYFCELFEVGKACRCLFLCHARNLPDELEILFGCEEIDEETRVDIGSGVFLPLLALCRIDALRGFFAAGAAFCCERDAAAVGFQKVEHEAEKRCLSGAVVAHQTYDFAVVDAETAYIDSRFLSEYLCKVVYSYFHILCSFQCMMPYCVCETAVCMVCEVMNFISNLQVSRNIL